MLQEVYPVKNCQLALKRLFDLIVCTGALVVLLPVMLIISIVVKLSSQGPVLFVQERVGKDERLFRILKFRTMLQTVDVKIPPAWSRSDELRTTRAGRFLRDYGLDELPQLINIIRGDMSVIGPRPPLPALAAQFTENQRIMFRMRPGVLSLAAVEGRRSIPMSQRIDKHVLYVENWSLCLDAGILWRSLFVVLSRRDASETIVVEDIPTKKVS